MTPYYSAQAERWCQNVDWRWRNQRPVVAVIRHADATKLAQQGGIGFMGDACDAEA